MTPYRETPHQPEEDEYYADGEDDYVYQVPDQGQAACGCLIGALILVTIVAVMMNVAFTEE